MFTTTASQAQNSGGMQQNSYSDSTMIPGSRLAQHRDFENGQYDFPAKRNNQWEVGVNFGQVNIFGDVVSKSIATHHKALPLGFGFTVRKSLGYLVSLRAQFMHGTASGFNFQPGYGGYLNKGNNPWNDLGYAGQKDPRVAYNYKTTMNEFSLQTVFALNNIKFHSARNKVSYYALAGIGGLSYKVMVDALDGSGQRYNFGAAWDGLSGTNWENRKTINTRLKSLLDGNYESPAESNTYKKPGSSTTMSLSGTAGLGVQFRLSKLMTLQIEDRIIYTGSDYLDGVKYQENTPGSASFSSNNDMINYASIGLNFNLGGNAIAPLWWVNPLDYTYHELKAKTAPKSSKCDLDSDGDGISDCFDRCPNTPANVTVDSHGCPFDTDGDGVPDYKDKQLITPTECQPVDADGVGKCPDPECCKNAPAPVGCGNVPSGSLIFGVGSSKLSSSATSSLNSLANALRSNPNCKAVIIGNGSGSKVEQQRSWDRVNSVINYMVDKQGIDRDRFIFQYGQGGGDANSVNYRAAGTGEEGPSNTPPPFPNLRK